MSSPSDPDHVVVPFASAATHKARHFQIAEKIPGFAEIAASDASILLMGETGTGKEVTARAIHDLSKRKKGPFEAIICAAIPPDLMESELFGHEKGAFTGAVIAKEGIFRLANSGTVLLDEIAEMRPHHQVKLLRALQERKVRPVGGNKEHPFDVRVIAATNVNIAQALEQNKLRLDLYYRLNVFELSLDPLRTFSRERKVALSNYLVDKIAATQGLQRRELSRSALEEIIHQQWPGNIRQLENVLHGALILCKTDEIEVRHLRLPSRTSAQIHTGLQQEIKHAARHAVREGLDYKTARDAFGKALIEEALIENDGNKAATAQSLNMGRPHLHVTMRKYGLTTSEPPNDAPGLPASKPDDLS